MLPKTAIIAVTLNCNAKCIMCNIWKNKATNEIKPEEYVKLPHTLQEINITGGEPFLRNDLDQIIRNIKQVCKDSRIVISSNGYLYSKIKSKLEEIKKIDPKVALRVSIDGIQEKHDKIRGLNNAFKNALETLRLAKDMKIKDLGIAMTISRFNEDQIYDVYELSKKLNIQMALMVTFESEIYFGKIDENIRNIKFNDFKEQIYRIGKERIKTIKPKEWARAWFEDLLIDYVREKKRPFSCDAGKGFFYMDSMGNVYGCHIINNYIGNLRDYITFKDLWENEKRKSVYEKAIKCNKCWMVCTAKSEISRRKLRVAVEIIKKKFIG